MNAEQFSSALGKVNDKYIVEAAAYKRKKKAGWLKWGAIAACLCLILTAAIVTLPGFWGESGGVVPPPVPNPTVPGGGNIPGENQGGTFTDGVDPIIESLAVYPATEDIRDVEDAAIESMDETAAYGVHGLGDYLPTELPTGYHFDKASLYETTMKSGTKYHLLRVTFAAGKSETPTSPTSEDGGVLAPDPNSFGSSFAVFIMDYEPKTKKGIYRFEDLPEFLETSKDNTVFHFSCGDVYIGFSPSELSTEEIFTVINSISHIPERDSEPAEYPETAIIPGFDLNEPNEPATP